MATVNITASQVDSTINVGATVNILNKTWTLSGKFGLANTAERKFYLTATDGSTLYISPIYQRDVVTYTQNSNTYVVDPDFLRNSSITILQAATFGPYGLSMGSKTVTAEVTTTAGSGTMTVTIYGTSYDTATNGVLIGTITLSGASPQLDSLTFVSNFYKYYFVISSFSGTGVSGKLTVS